MANADNDLKRSVYRWEPVDPANPDDLTIIADHREKASGIIEMLTADELFDVRVVELGVGDYLVADLVIERKTGNDFVCSLEDGGLFKQLFLMKRAYRRRALIIEGEPRLNDRAVENVLTKITTGLQIPILWSHSPMHTAVLIKRAALQLYKLTTSSPVVRKAETREDLQFQLRYVLLGFPHIGIKRADALLAKFGSLDRIFAASPEELMQIPGIGDRHAQRLRDLLCSRWPAADNST